jgi:enterochelin esterase family protein
MRSLKILQLPFLAFALCAIAGPLWAAQFEVLDIPGAKLKDNPLGDPAARHVAVFKPDGTKDDASLPLVVYLPGWGGSCEDVIPQGAKAWLGVVVDQMVARKMPLRLAAVDCRSRYGGSQYLNSTATGNYADYVVDEILPALEAKYAVQKDGTSPIVAGHSSGGYGALIFAINQHEKFAAVVALSPDSNFEVTHKPLVQNADVQAVTPAELEAAMAPKGQAKLPASGLVRLVLGLSANYTPIDGTPGKFDWLYDEKHQFRADVWKRWIDQDPLMIVRRNDEAFASSQRIYLDGASEDEFGANIGARKIFMELKNRASPVHFHEPEGHHSDHLIERLSLGLTWVFDKNL